mmetsp:Transcript_20077/g.47402  ORF Transcript_20077/g.47402 Transcript_20077/m.47402 type:complete len:255 (-) Transcript_20077:281-1045(-)
MQLGRGRRHAIGIARVACVHPQRHHHVRAARVVVHVGAAHGAARLTLSDQPQQGLDLVSHTLAQPVYEDAATTGAGVLFDAQVDVPGRRLRLVRVGSSCREEVVQFLVVDLAHREAHAHLLGARQAADAPEELGAQLRDDAGVAGRPLHRVGLARAGLPVGEDAAVVAVEHLPEDHPARARIDLGVGRVASKAGVEGEASGLSFGVGADDAQLAAALYGDAFLGARAQLSRVQRPHPHLHKHGVGCQDALERMA